jgi:hypothetical protein
MSDRDVVIRVEGVSKLYRLGEVGTGSLAHDFNRWWHKVRGKEDPYLKVGEVLGIIGRNGAGTQAAWQPLGRLPQAARRVRRPGLSESTGGLLRCWRSARGSIRN